MAKVAEFYLDFNEGFDIFKSSHDETQSHFENLHNQWKAHFSNGRKGDLIGFIWSAPVADGYANYMVVNQSPLELAHIDWLDGYSVADAHIRGLTVEDIRQYKNGREALAKLFSKAN
jgi:hypothetical protein